MKTQSTKKFSSLFTEEDGGSSNVVANMATSGLEGKKSTDLKRRKELEESGEDKGD